MISELDYKKNIVLEYLRTKSINESNVITFEVSQKDIYEYFIAPRLGKLELRDTIKQLTTNNELGVILEHLTDETNKEFILKSSVPILKKDSLDKFNDPTIDEMLNTAVDNVAKELGTFTEKANSKHHFTPPTTEWNHEYKVWIVEYHPENKDKQRKPQTDFNPYIFYITKDRFLAQFLPNTGVTKLKLSPTEYEFLLVLNEEKPRYVPAVEISQRTGSDTKYIRNLSQSLRKGIVKTFIGITENDFIESDNGYRISKKINLSEKEI